MSNDQKYQGWTNYETWCVHLWLTNDEGSYLQVMEWAKQFTSGEDEPHGRELMNFADFLKEEISGEIAEVPGLNGDLLTHAYGMVDWMEIAKALLEMAEEL